MSDQPEEVTSQSAPPAATFAAMEPQYQGVGGWLLFLCVSLTILAPLFTVIVFAAGYREASEYFDEFPGLQVITVIDLFLSLGLMAFSIYAGTGLWSIRPGAVRVAKQYLLCYLGYRVIAAILPFMAGLPAEANGVILEEVFGDLFRGVIYFAIWYSYLNQSKRVNATYDS